MASSHFNDSDSDKEDFSLADDIPLANLQKCKATTPIEFADQDETENEDMSLGLDDFDDSDTDPSFKPGKCEVKKCGIEVFAACTSCLALLCYDHFLEDPESCSQHGKTGQSKNVEPVVHGDDETDENQIGSKRLPESFDVEGSARQVTPKKRKRVNKKNDAKRKRQSGEEYVSADTKKVVPARMMRKGCIGTECTRAGRQCSGISESDREEIFQDFYKLSDLQKEREFVARHIETTEPKLGKPKSRRSKTHTYYLTINGKRVKVCRNTFLATLGISEKFVKVVLAKITETGIVETDKRGGRQSEQMKTKEELNRENISRHIDRFPRMESHYCRASSSKEYLNPDLTLSKMYDMFVKDNSGNDIPSFHTYRRVFKTKNLAFHSPKKDQCSLCNSFRKGDEAQKNELREIYDRHDAEKQKVRKLKEECKKMAQADNSILAGNFDLQQVIYLPISHEDALFYKRKLSNYNLTFYNLGDHTCDCFVWHEGQSRRGSSEISTAVCRALREYDQKGIKAAYLFADGCPGQNKNTIMPTMMLHVINTSEHMEELSLRYFESFHGQCEGDSAHSAISTALAHAGDVFLPSQLFPIITLARRKQPYRVHPLEHDDFLNFKKLSEDLQIRNIRNDNQGSGFPVNWNKVMEVRVNRAHPTTIFFKTSHLEEEYRSISLKRKHAHLVRSEIPKLNEEPNKISREKYGDLLSLCSGNTPVIRNAERKAFYFQLPHSE